MKVIENKFYSKDSVDKTAIIFVCSLLFQAEAVLPTYASQTPKQKKIPS